MRSHRTTTGPVGLALAVLLVLAGPAPAPAAPDGHARALPEREITSKVVDKGNRLVLRGNVDPGHARRTVVVQKRTCATDECGWFAFERVRTNDRGGFRQRIGAPEDGYWYWRAKVRRYGGYGTSYSSTWRTYTV